MSKRKDALQGAILAALWAGSSIAPLQAGGVTIVTHGFNGTITDWIIPMVDAMAAYPELAGASSSCYQLDINAAAGPAVAVQLGGPLPTASESGEIFIKLDWSAVAGIFPSATSTQVATAAVAALVNSSLTADTGGRALAELPLHLVGHSRGGSVVTEMARLLGEQGIWVEQVTTLDPRPVGLLGDPSAVTNWENVYFADNYWQDIGAADGITGMTVTGAYNRKLLNLDGGNASSHSDTHLWYHGTIDDTSMWTGMLQPAIGAEEREDWWTAAEMEGAAAGYLYTRLGGGDRFSEATPAGPGTDRIRDGINGLWDFGGDAVVNRSMLAVNSGLWPNVIQAALTGPGSVAPGDSFDIGLSYQAGASASGEVELSILLDPDANPWNGNELALPSRMLAKTGPNAVAQTVCSVPTGATPPGSYRVAARLVDGTRSRLLYAVDALEVSSSAPAPMIDASTLRIEGGLLRFTVLGTVGQTVHVQASEDLDDWETIATEVLAADSWEFSDPDTALFDGRYYRLAW